MEISGLSNMDCVDSKVESFAFLSVHFSYPQLTYHVKAAWSSVFTWTNKFKFKLVVVPDLIYYGESLF